MTIEIMIWGGSAGILGLILGYLGYLHSKMAYSIFITSLGIITFFSNQIVQLTGGDISGLSGGSSDPSAYMGFGILRKVMSAIDAMGLLPQHVQIAILVFVASFFITRIATWGRKSFGPQKAEETLEERKKRILASYGMKSTDDVRRLR